MKGVKLKSFNNNNGQKKTGLEKMLLGELNNEDSEESDETLANIPNDEV